MLSNTRKRLVILISGYAAVAVFLGTFIAVKELWSDLPWSTALALAAVVAVPIPLALLWDRITAFRIFSFEVTLHEFTVYVDQSMAAAVQEQKSSKTPEIVRQIGQISAKDEIETLEINLRDGKYWWPTRLYLLAALADEYTRIKIFIFVDGEPERRFIGMATPLSTRRAMAEAFMKDQYEEKYCRAQGLTKLPQLQEALSSKIESICYAWPSQFGKNPKDEETSIRDCLVDKKRLKTWLGDQLDEGHISWDGQVTRLLQFQIVNRQAMYTPLVQDGKLSEVTSRGRLALRIAEASLRREIG